MSGRRESEGPLKIFWDSQDPGHDQIGQTQSRVTTKRIF